MPERILYSGETFTYIECSNCGSLTLADAPDNLDSYYPNDYYSFTPTDDRTTRSRLATSLRHALLRSVLTNSTTAKSAVALAARAGIPVEPWVGLLGGLGLHRQSPILDVGCGSGHRLMTLRRFGFRHLMGVDAHLPEPKVNKGRGSGVRLVRGTVTDVSGSFDLIMFHHSLEHMAQPAQALRAVTSILSPQGAVIVRVPLVQSFAWRTYGLNWVQLDTPRHLNLFTAKAFRILAARCGLEIREVIYDSNAFQFWGSEMHKRGIPMRQGGAGTSPPASVFPPRELARFRRRARLLNAKADGDQAAFLLTHGAPSDAQRNERRHSTTPDR